MQTTYFLHLRARRRKETIRRRIIQRRSRRPPSFGQRLLHMLNLVLIVTMMKMITMPLLCPLLGVKINLKQKRILMKSALHINMSSPTSSSSPTLDELIHQILNTTEDVPGFDLQQLISTIDGLLHHYNNRQEKISHIREKVASVVTGLPSASNASKFSEGVYENVKIIASQISQNSEDKHQTSIAVLNAIGNVHWVGVGFLLVAAVLETMDTIKNNKMECLRLLKSMNDLAKIIMQLRPLPHLNKEMQAKMKESIHLIVNGAILCCSQKKRGKLSRYLKSSNDAQDLQKLGKEVDDMCKMLNLQINASTLEGVQRSLVSISPPLPTLNEDAVGIEQKIDEVIKQLDWEDDKPTVAVVVYGIGGSGKTTLADAVYASLKDKLEGWRHSKVTLIQNLEREPNVEALQSLILQDLTGTKHDVRDFQSGRRSLKDIIEKESIFLYIDNALFLEPLEKLLPKEVTSAKKLRMLLTARETNVSGVIEDCRIKPCELYSMEALSGPAALQVLCSKIDRDRDTRSIVDERPQAKWIAEKCKCCPLYLEVVGAYLHQRKNTVEAYENVLRWLECGEDFSGNKKYIFDESRVLFSYEGLQPSAQEAFLDICSFFCEWKWEDVACIVGKEELECLQDGALLKRKGRGISIHDLILAAGRHKSRHNRFTTADALRSILKNELVSQIKGIWLNYWHEKPFHISAQVLDVMSPSLRVLAMGGMTIVEGKCSKQFNELRFLQVGRVPNLPINISNLKHMTYLDYGFGKDMILSSSKNLSSLKVLKFRKRNDSRIVGITEFAHLHKIKQLALYECSATEIPQTFSKLHNLEKLELSSCPDLTELPESICKLTSLRVLNLRHCEKLKQLPAGIGQLGTLTSLCLSGCQSLQELPRDLEKLSSLQLLDLSHCSSLRGVPHGIGDLKSLWGSNVDFDGCSNLRELPNEIFKYAMPTRMSLSNCSSLKMLPSRFSELTCLQSLLLSECKSLQELCNDFHCLVGLRSLNMRNCKSLSSLPLGFGKLSSLENLNLSGCDKLEELCSDFHCLGALKSLELSGCHSLSKLPDCFGQLGCLEILNLSGCSNLEKLCDDFRCLPSLIKLGLSKCENLGAEWMDRVAVIKSMWSVKIVGSERIIQRWIELKKEKERWHFVVDTQGGWRPFILEAVLEVVLSRVLDEEGLLQWAHHSSSVLPHTPLILIIDKYEGARKFLSSKWELFGKRVQQVECIAKDFQIIYIGRAFNALPSELAVRILAHTPPNSHTSSFCHKLFAHFQSREYISIFSSTDGFSEWEDISDMIWDEVKFLTKTPRESNIELLRALLVTKETDYLLLNKNQQVKVADLEGKMILLLPTSLDAPEMWISALKDVYLKMQESHKSVFEVVWTPLVIVGINTWEEYERAAANAPWPMVPNPWSISKQLRHLIENKSRRAVVVVDGKGRICRENEDAMAMIERWGVEAYPFCERREEELRKAEWEGFKVNSQSALEFVFQNVELRPTKEKEVMLCVGSVAKMIEFVPDLSCALTMLESDTQVFYVGGTSFTDYWPMEKVNEFEIKRKDICTVVSLSFSDVYKFWQRVQHLCNDLKGMGTDEKIEKVKKMVKGLKSANNNRRHNEMGISMVVVDKKGEMISGRGIEVVKMLCHGDEDNKKKLLMDIKYEGLQKAMERRWRE